MPTVAELERLKALVDRLAPVSGVVQGELIRAGDWNALVGAVIEIARAVLAQEIETTPAAHEHPDQVTAGWLEPRLRALIERGPLSDPAAMIRLSALEQRIDRLGSRIEDVNGNLGDVRDRVTEVTTRDLVRQADVTSVRRVVEGLSDSRESVVELRETLRTLQADVSTAVTVGRGLMVDGQPVDMQALVGRLSSVEELRDRLKQPDGSLLDASALEHRLTELTNTLVTQETLDAALATISRDLSPDQLESITGTLRNELSSQVNDSVETLAGQIRAETDARFQEIDATVAQAVSNAMPNIMNSVLNTVRPEIATAVSKGLEQSQALFEKRLSETTGALGDDLSQKIADVQLNIENSVRGEFERQLPGHIAVITEQVTKLARLVEPMSARLDTVEERVAKTADRVEEVNQDLLKRISVIQPGLVSTLDERFAVLRAEMDTRATQADARTRTQIDAAIADSQRALLDKVSQVAITAATNQVNLMKDQLRTEMITISRDQIAGMQDQLRAGVDAQINASLARLPDLVRTEISAAQPALRDSIVSEVTRLRPPQ